MFNRPPLEKAETVKTNLTHFRVTVLGAWSSAPLTWMDAHRCPVLVADHSILKE